MSTWHLLKIKKEIHVCIRKANKRSSKVTFWFHRLQSLSVKSEILLDVGDLHNILQPSLPNWFSTLNPSVDLTACTSFDVTDYNKHGQVHVSQSIDKRYDYNVLRKKKHIPISLLKDLSNPVLPSCELYSFHVVYICTFLCVAVERSWLEGLLWCIFFHQFGLNWTFIEYYAESSALGGILPVVRDFCSLYLCTFRPTSLAATNPWGASRVVKNFWRRNCLWTRK